MTQSSAAQALPAAYVGCKLVPLFLTWADTADLNLLLLGELACMCHPTKTTPIPAYDTGRLIPTENCGQQTLRL